MTRQPPAGRYRGGLWGQRADPSVGLLLPSGPFLSEDWMRYGDSGNDYGECGWTLTTVGGAGATLILSAPSADTELGIAALRSSTTSGRGATLNLASVQMLYTPPIGMVWATKVDMSVTTNIEVWSGFGSSQSSRVRTSDNTEFIGVRYLGSGTWEGVCKDGSTSGNESTVALDTPSAGTFVSYGFEAVDTDGAGTLGIQFFSITADSRDQLFRTLVGDPITTNIPQTTGPIALGVVTTTNGQRIAYQDFYCYGGRTAR